MDYVVDFQAFHDDCNNYIIKELSVQTIENVKPVGTRKQYLFLPPFDYRHLSEKKKKEAYWLKKNFHGFSWNCGLQDYDELYLILNELAKGRCVYVKGLEKKTYLEKVINKSLCKIIDINILKCPSLNVLNQQSTYTVDCPYKHNLKHCAANNVYNITGWILNFWNSTCDCKVIRKNKKRLDCSNCINLLY